MTDQPSDEILAYFAIRVIAPLGGRRNRHWLVAAGRDRLVLRRWAQPMASVAYEARLIGQIAAMGWPVAPVVAGPIQVAGHIWSLAAFLPGDPPAALDPKDEHRARGRLLAAFHADLARLPGGAQREPWRRAETILTDPALDHLLAAHEPTQPEPIRIVRWHLERARLRIRDLGLGDRPGMIIHGDFTPWNLRFQQRQLAGILDFELAHWDHRVAEFALAWRGKHDAVIHGYVEVSPLDAEEWAMIPPLWWAWLIEGFCHDLRTGTPQDGWTIKKLLERSPLMGPDAGVFR